MRDTSQKNARGPFGFFFKKKDFLIFLWARRRKNPTEKNPLLKPIGPFPAPLFF
jgi:hypothetical protein